MILSCPFVIEFTFPISISIASKIAMKYGILIKDNVSTFKKLNSLNIVVFNKQQVITSGNPNVMEIVLNKNFVNFDKENIFFEILKSLENYSFHLYAKSIKKYIKKMEKSQKKVFKTFEVVSYRETEGYNVSAKIRILPSTSTNFANYHEAKILTINIGCEKWMQKQKCHQYTDQRRLKIWDEQGYSTLFVAINKNIVGMIGIYDSISDNMKEEIKVLKDNYGIVPWLISNDNEVSTKATARSIGISESNCLYNVLPSERIKKIEWLKHHTVGYEEKKMKEGRPVFNQLKNSVVSFLSRDNESLTYSGGSTANHFNYYNNKRKYKKIESYQHQHDDGSSSSSSMFPSTTTTASSSTTANNKNSITIHIDDNEVYFENEDKELMNTSSTKKRNIVAYIGNGITDNDVLSVSDIGLCLGIKNDISLDTSVITTIYQNIQSLNTLLKLTKYIINYSYNTIIYLLLIHILLIPVASGMFYPFIWLNPILIFLVLFINLCIHWIRANKLKNICL